MRRLIFHLAVVTHHLFCAYFFSTVDKSVSNETVIKMNAIRGSFLTGWNFALQGIFFAVSLADDVVRLNKTLKPQIISPSTYKTLQTVKDVVFTSVVFPLSCFVSLVFWVFFTYDRELVYPVALDEALPLWFNHSLHTGIIVVAILELCLVYHPYPKRKLAIACILTVNAIYAICLLLTRYYSGMWVYPMFANMNWPQRLCYIPFCGFIVIGLCELGHWVSSNIWGDKVARTRVTGVKKSS